MDELRAHAGAWIEHARRAHTASELEAIYASIAQEVEARAPACWASGRCCNFTTTGHRLYCSGLEAAYTLVRLDRAPERSELDDARARGGCALQVRNLCGAHAVRPLGCRVYFCDRSATRWQRDLSERTLAEVRALHDRHAIAYVYAEWGRLLESLLPLVRASQ